MVSALVNRVTGGKWFSLVDKVIRPTTLDAAWRKVARNNGAAGVDGQSIKRFAAQAERYLQELHLSLRDGSYRPHPVKRVEIPKGAGPTPSSRIAGCSPFAQPTGKRDTPDEETNDWRAVCGRTARTVRRAGRHHLPDSYRGEMIGCLHPGWRTPAFGVLRVSPSPPSPAVRARG
jgi:hypothetical protein